MYDKYNIPKKPEKFIPPYVKSKLNSGGLLPQELEKYFPLTKSEIEAVKKGPRDAAGLLGVIVSLEDTILDLRGVFDISTAFFGESLKNSFGSRFEFSSDPRSIHDIIGSSFKESMRYLGWSLKDVENDLEMKELSSKFYQVFYFTLNKFPEINPYPGAVRLLKEVINDDNELVVMTSLPRQVAVRAIERAQLTQLFNGRVNSDRLVSLYDPVPIEDNETADLTFKQHIIRSCGLMHKNVLNSMFISANRHNVLIAKRMGLNAIALKGLTKQVHDLRVADELIDSLEDISINYLYKVFCSNVKMEEGPGLQPQWTRKLETTRKQYVASPMLDRKPKEVVEESADEDMVDTDSEDLE